MEDNVTESTEPEVTPTETPEVVPVQFKRAYCKNCAKDIYVPEGSPEYCTNCTP